jgi:hypothetical protein
MKQKECARHNDFFGSQMAYRTSLFDFARRIPTEYE